MFVPLSGIHPPTPFVCQSPYSAKFCQLIWEIQPIAKILCSVSVFFFFFFFYSSPDSSCAPSTDVSGYAPALRVRNNRVLLYIFPCNCHFFMAFNCIKSVLDNLFPMSHFAKLKTVKVAHLLSPYLFFCRVFLQESISFWRFLDFSINNFQIRPAQAFPKK